MSWDTLHNIITVTPRGQTGMLLMQLCEKLNNSFYKFQLKAYTEVKKNWHSIRELNVKL